MFNDTIVAQATPQGLGGVSIVRVSGPKAIDIGKRLTKKSRTPEAKTPTLYTIYSRQNKRIDQALVTYFNAPHSYTGEDIIEIACHGNPLIVQEIIKTACKNGARSPNPGEFTMRSFINGKMDLIQAEAVASLIESKSLTAANISNKVLSGSLSRAIKNIKKNLIFLVSTIEYEIDISEGFTTKQTAQTIYKVYRNSCLQCEKLLENYYDNDMFLIPRIVITGEPNVGKSTILNKLVGEDRAIVNSKKGTTRDSIEVHLSINKTQAILVDTAGIRSSKDEIEVEGIERAKSAVDKADIIIYVVTKNSNVPHFKEGKDHLFVFNKTDLYEKPKRFEKAIGVSATKNKNIHKLKKALSTLLKNREKSHRDVLITTQRQFDCIQQCLGFLKRIETFILKGHIYEPEIVSLDVREGIKELDVLLGKTTPDDILRNIFSNFCVGK